MKSGDKTGDILKSGATADKIGTTGDILKSGKTGDITYDILKSGETGIGT